MPMFIPVALPIMPMPMPPLPMPLPMLPTPMAGGMLAPMEEGMPDELDRLEDSEGEGPGDMLENP